MNGQELVDAGTHRLCTCGQTLILVSRDCCRSCAALPAPRAATKPVPRRRRTGQRVGDAKVDPSRLGVLGGRSDGIVRFAVAGKPITQGSMAAIAPGVVKHDSSSELKAWRTAVHRALLTAVGLGKESADCPLRVHAVFTVPMDLPAGGGTAGKHTVAVDPDCEVPPRVAPSTKPDLDKLIRAVGDALTPRKQWRLCADDSRIVEWSTAKTFPAPAHVHPWALAAPGVVLQVSPIDVPVQWPSTTLVNPGNCPPEILAVTPEALRVA